jgi:glycosyltransferase involved in cell wall biosynthesis
VKRIALVVPNMATDGGGVRIVAEFLYNAISSAPNYQIDVFSLATSVRDPQSVRLLSPHSWTRSIRFEEGRSGDITYMHVGAMFTEFEFQRYKPRRILTDRLKQYDLVQVVTGTPAWAAVTLDVDVPVCVFVATTAALERVAWIERLSGWRRWWLQAMTKLNCHFEHAALNHAACVFALSKYTFSHLQSQVPADRLVLAPTGVDTDLFRPNPYRPKGAILAVGRFADARKNVRLLFEAYAELKKTMPDAPPLHLAGKSLPTPSDWEYARALNIASFLHMHENASLEALANMYREASLFVLSSDEEGLGIVILEAMASGLPVVSTACGGPETAVIDGVTGYLTPVGDAGAMASKMGELLQNAELRLRMGMAGRKTIEERFSIEATRNAYLQKYNELLTP